MDAFAAFRGIAQGGLAEEWERQMAMMAETVAQAPEKAKAVVILEFTFERDPKADEELVAVSGVVKIKVPAPKARGRYYYAQDGGFHSRSLRQGELPELRSVPDSGGEIRVASNDEAVRRTE